MTRELDAPLILSEAALEQPSFHEVARGKAAVFSAPWRPSEKANEDVLALIPVGGDGGVIAVADGAGGAPLGGRAARLAVEALIASVGNSDAGAIRDRILDGFEQANRAVLDLGVGAATTLAVVEIGEGGLRSYHAGDSAVLLTGQRGKIKLATLAHAPVAYAVEAGLLEESDALLHEDRNVVSNMVGTADMRVEMGSTTELSPRDTMVLGSDGLFDNLAAGEIAEIIRRGALQEAATALVNRCRGRMSGSDANLPSKPDDLSFVLFRRLSPRNS